jgi:hypothetical protein
VIDRVTADKDLFERSHYHIVVRENGETLIGKEAYEPILKRAGLADNNRYLGADYRVDPAGGILIMLMGASLVRMQDALVGLDHDINFITVGEDATEYPNRIADDAMVEIYYRVEAPESNIDTVMAALSDIREPYKTGDFDTGGCWLAYVRRQTAESAVEILNKSLIDCRLVDVDYNGVRIIEEGVDYATVIDSAAESEEPPLPWNAQSAEFYALDEAAQKKSLKGRWLSYSIRKFDYPTGLIIHITPTSYFKVKRELWSGDFPIDHLIPDSLEKYGDKVGVYQCKSLNLNHCDFLLGNRVNMNESLMLRAHLNQMGKEAFQ